MTGKEIDQLRNPAPQFFYGYIIVVLAFVILVVSWGLYAVFGVFFNPLLDEFHWTRAMTSGAFALSMILHGALGIFMGALADKFGSRVVVTCCGVLLGLGYLLMSQLSTLWQFYLFYGVLIGIGISGIWVPLLSCVARWFVERRSLMTAIVASGVGIGGLIAPPVISRLIASYGWRLSFVFQGIVILVVMISASQFLKRDPADKDQTPYGGNEEKSPGLISESKGYSVKEAFRTGQFWLSFAIFFSYGFLTFSILVHIVPYAIEKEILAIDAANIMASIGGLSVLGNFLLGSFGDRAGNKKIFVIGFVMMSVMVFWLGLAREIWMIYICTVVFGLALGGMATSESPLVARLFGLRSHGLIYGIVGFGYTLGSSIGPVVTGHLFDLTGSYHLAFQVCAALGAAGCILATMLRPTGKMGIKL
jgi:MFS family permease